LVLSESGKEGRSTMFTLIEKDKDGQRKDHYVGPLDKIVKTYLALGVLEDPFVPTLSFHSFYLHS